MYSLTRCLYDMQVAKIKVSPARQLDLRDFNSGISLIHLVNLQRRAFSFGLKNCIGFNNQSVSF